MERTSLITALYIGKASNYPSLVLVGGFPDTNSLSSFFTKMPIALEKSDLKETVEDSDQGQLLDIAIRANLYRDATEYTLFANSHVMAYLETSNGERHFFGSADNPLIYQYTRDSGATNADPRDTTLLLGQKIPL